MLVISISYGHLGSPEVGLPLGFAGIIISMVLLKLGQMPLSVHDHVNGIQFRLKGCKAPFFDRLRKTYPKQTGEQYGSTGSYLHAGR